MQQCPQNPRCSRVAVIFDMKLNDAFVLSSVHCPEHPIMTTRSSPNLGSQLQHLCILIIPDCRYLKQTEESADADPEKTEYAMLVCYRGMEVPYLADACKLQTAARACMRAPR